MMRGAGKDPPQWARQPKPEPPRNVCLYDRDVALDFIRTLVAIHGIKPSEILQPEEEEKSCC